MTKSGNRGSGMFTWRCVAAGVVLVIYAGAVALVSRTLVDWQLVFAASALAAIFTSLISWKIWRWLTGSGRFVWNLIIGTVIFTGVFSAAYYIVNYSCADRSTTHMERAIVERVFYKERHRSKRVGRNRYVQGEAYHVYFMQVRLSNGMSKELEIPFREYRKTRKGKEINLPVAAGALGAPVILYSSKTES